MVTTPSSRQGLLVLLTALVFGGCSVHSVPKLEEDSLRTALRQRGVDPARIVHPFELNDEIRLWAHKLAPVALPDEEKLHRLLVGLLDSKDLQLQYSWGFTGTAQEVYESHRANCLAFTNLFLGMAREVEVPVYFLAVETETYRKDGDLVVVSDHIAVGYGEGPSIRSFDFSERTSSKLRHVRRISDITAVATYYSNRGAEYLQAGDLMNALQWLRTSVELDPAMPKSWVNLGVVRRRLGNAAAAEQAYRVALELDPATHSAYQNLAALLRQQERIEEAEEFELALQELPLRNPFTYLSLGDISFRHGRLEEARRLYRRAASLGRNHADSYAALGQLAAASGNLKEARRLLEKARKIDQTSERTSRLASMIHGGP